MSNRSYLRSILYLYITTLDKSIQFSIHALSRLFGQWLNDLDSPIERDALSLWVQNPLNPTKKRNDGASHESNQSKT